MSQYYSRSALSVASRSENYLSFLFFFLSLSLPQLGLALGKLLGHSISVSAALKTKIILMMYRVLWCRFLNSSFYCWVNFKSEKIRCNKALWNKLDTVIWSSIILFNTLIQVTLNRIVFANSISAQFENSTLFLVTCWIPGRSNDAWSKFFCSVVTFL